MNEERQNFQLNYDISTTDLSSHSQNNAIQSSIATYQDSGIVSTDPTINDGLIRVEQNVSSIVGRQDATTDVSSIGMPNTSNYQTTYNTSMSGGGIPLFDQSYNNPLMQSSEIYTEQGNEVDIPYYSDSQPTNRNKRPPTAYNLFSKEYFNKMRYQNTTTSPVVLMSQSSELWNQLSEEQRRPYEECAKRDKDRYLQEQANSMAQEQKEGISKHSKTRKKQAYLYAALENHNVDMFVKGLLACCDDNRKKAYDLILSVYNELSPTVNLAPMQMSYAETQPYPYSNINPITLQEMSEVGALQGQGKKYKCDQCDMKYNTSSGLYKHMQKHKNPDELYTCQECNKEYKTKHGLNLHIMKKHTTDRPYKCDKCSLGFVRKSDRQLHILRCHDNRRDFVCDICQKAFVSKFELTRHKKTHSL